MQQIHARSRILDLGCGNGALWRNLQRTGFGGFYVGIDSSVELLNIARDPVPLLTITQPLFIHLDLASSDWDQIIREDSAVADPNSSPQTFDVILAFAVLHHVPGRELRQQILKKAHDLLNKDGLLIHSEWQFLSNPRLKSRIQPWESIGLDETALEDGDYLLDWRHGGEGRRYVHLFSESELCTLAKQTLFTPLETFYSDGEDSKTSLYQVWKKDNNNLE
jgi:2-polyprenyl-3-methyl-5-hydroxy-6-metoxy-1,4-benzoquinol methylase